MPITTQQNVFCKFVCSFLASMVPLKKNRQFYYAFNFSWAIKSTYMYVLGCDFVLAHNHPLWMLLEPAEGACQYTLPGTDCLG